MYERNLQFGRSGRLDCGVTSICVLAPRINGKARLGLLPAGVNSGWVGPAAPRAEGYAPAAARLARWSIVAGCRSRSPGSGGPSSAVGQRRVYRSAQVLVAAPQYGAGGPSIHRVSAAGCRLPGHACLLTGQSRAATGGRQLAGVAGGGAGVDEAGEQGVATAGVIEAVMARLPLPRRAHHSIATRHTLPGGPGTVG
jgi:hypothetical protein